MACLIGFLIGLAPYVAFLAHEQLMELTRRHREPDRAGAQSRPNFWIESRRRE